MKRKIIFVMALFLFVSFCDVKAFSNNEINTMSDEEIMQYINIYYLIQNGDLYSPDYETSNKQYASQKDVELYKEYIKTYSNLTRASGYSKYFNSSKWITRSGVVSLSVDYKGSALYPNNIPAANFAVAKTAFQELYKKHKSSAKWKNTASMEAQFLCHHCTIGRAKNPWNLEPHRTESDLNKVISKACNP